MTGDLEEDPLLSALPVVAGYHVLEPCVLYGRIGIGGMATVYIGRHLNLDIEVAVKCLKPGLAKLEPDFVDRFQREAKVAARINHPNLIRVFDVSERNGVHFLVMEFVLGESARQRVERKGPLAVDEALVITMLAARGLAAAHEVGVVHRDVKPDNILVSAKGDVKVADLGIVKTDMESDEEGVTLGTPEYMPPEQFEDMASVGPAGDVWALAATLFYLLTGEHPVQGEGYTRIVEEVTKNDFPDIREHRDDLPDGLYEIMDQATQKDPAWRFANAHVMAQQLESLLGKAPGLSDRGAGTLHRRRELLPPSDAVMQKVTEALASGAARAPARPGRAAPGPRPKAAASMGSPEVPRPRRDRRRSGKGGIVMGLVAVAVLGAFLFIGIKILTGGDGGDAATNPDDGGSGGDGPPSVLQDTSPPYLAVAAPSAGHVTSRAMILVEGTASDDAGIEKVTVDGATVSTASGPFSHSVTLDADGRHAIEIVAIDVNGLKTSQTVGVYRDQTAPLIAFTSPVADAKVGSGAVIVKGIWQDERGGVVTLNGMEIRVRPGAETWEGRCTPPAAGGAMTITARAKDLVGNASEPITMTVTVASRHRVPAWAKVVDEFGYDDDSRLPLRVIDTKTGIELALMRPGRYFRGAIQNDPMADADERPAHQVQITRPYYLGLREVTRAQWKKIMGDEPGVPPGPDSLPVDSVSHSRVTDFCGRTGMRLPTEAEWEFACRAGKSYRFSGGDGLGPRDANVASAGPREIGSFPPNPWGFLDLHGNVAEFVADHYDPKAYASIANSVRDPAGPTKGRCVVMRGGSWRLGADEARCSERLWMPADQVRDDVGFRVVREP